VWTVWTRLWCITGLNWWTVLVYLACRCRTWRTSDSSWFSWCGCNRRLLWWPYKPSSRLDKQAGLHTTVTVTVEQCWNWPKTTGGSDVEMFEILRRDWNLKPIFTQKWSSVDMNWGRGGWTPNPRQFQPCCGISGVFFDQHSLPPTGNVMKVGSKRDSDNN